MQKTVDRYCVEGKNSAVAETTVQKIEENATDCRNSIEGETERMVKTARGGNKKADGRNCSSVNGRKCSKW
jgi:hypothetical protein